MGKRGRPSKCPFCGSTKTVAKGYRKTITMGLRPLRRCKACRRRFTSGRKIIVAEMLGGDGMVDAGTAENSENM